MYNKSIQIHRYLEIGSHFYESVRLEKGETNHMVKNWRHASNNWYKIKHIINESRNNFCPAQHHIRLSCHLHILKFCGHWNHIRWYETNLMKFNGHFLLSTDTKVEIEISVIVHCIDFRFYSEKIVNKIIILLINRKYWIIYQDITFSST